MKALKENFVVKTVYAYFDLGVKILPLFFLFFYAQQIWEYITFGKVEAGSLDIFKIVTHTSSGNYSLLSIQILFIVIINFVFMAGVYIALIKLRHFLKNVFENNPFVEENGKHLKYVGVVIIIMTIVEQTSKVFFAKDLSVPSTALVYLVKFAGLIGIVFNTFFVIGLFIYVIGEVIVHAAKLKQENDLTV